MVYYQLHNLEVKSIVFEKKQDVTGITIPTLLVMNVGMIIFAYILLHFGIIIN